MERKCWGHLDPAAPWSARHGLKPLCFSHFWSSEWQTEHLISVSHQCVIDSRVDGWQNAFDLLRAPSCLSHRLGAHPNEEPISKGETLC